jgi:hypothetical protein
VSAPQDVSSWGEVGLEGPIVAQATGGVYMCCVSVIDDNRQPLLLQGILGGLWREENPVSLLGR